MSKLDANQTTGPSPGESPAAKRLQPELPSAAPASNQSAQVHLKPDNSSPAEREAITFYRPMEDREADRAPLSGHLIRRIFVYTRPYRAQRNWLFILTLFRGLQLPALAWMIGETITARLPVKI
jgi:hypothetical protein